MKIKSAFATISIFSIIVLAGVSSATPPRGLINITTTLTSKASSVIAQATQLNLPLLVKTVTNFLRGDVYETDSQTRFSLGQQGTNVDFYMQSKTIVATPGKFRAEVVFTNPGDITKEPTLIICDGQKVSIYRPDLRQYTVMSANDFEKTNDSYLIGMSSALFLQVPIDAKQMVAQGKLSDKDVLSEIGLAANTAIKQNQQTINNVPLSVYNYTDSKAGWTISAFIQPETTTLKQVQVAGSGEGFNILMTEQILSRTENPLLTPTTFKFTPPQGAKLVKSLEITPF